MTNSNEIKKQFKVVIGGQFCEHKEYLFYKREDAEKLFNNKLFISPFDTFIELYNTKGKLVKARYRED